MSRSRFIWPTHLRWVGRGHQTGLLTEHLESQGLCSPFISGCFSFPCQLAAVGLCHFGAGRVRGVGTLRGLWPCGTEPCCPGLLIDAALAAIGKVYIHSGRVELLFAEQLRCLIMLVDLATALGDAGLHKRLPERAGRKPPSGSSIR